MRWNTKLLFAQPNTYNKKRHSKSSKSLTNALGQPVRRERNVEDVLPGHVSCPRAVVHYPRNTNRVLCETSPFVPRRDLVFAWIGKFCGANSPRVCTKRERERERKRRRRRRRRQRRETSPGVTSCTVYDVRWIIGRDGHSPLSDHIPSGETGPWLQSGNPERPPSTSGRFVPGGRNEIRARNYLNIFVNWFGELLSRREACKLFLRLFRPVESLDELLLSRPDRLISIVVRIMVVTVVTLNEQNRGITIIHLTKMFSTS